MKCHRVEEDCFAFGVLKECMCLSDTQFLRRPCPFYKKTKHDYDASYLFDKYPGTWKKVRGFNGKYYISDKGEVMNSQKHKVTPKYYGGKPFVSMQAEDGSQYRIYLEELIADAFCPGIGIIDFKDGNCMNCTAENIYRRRIRWEENRK